MKDVPDLIWVALFFLLVYSCGYVEESTKSLDCPTECVCEEVRK